MFSGFLYTHGSSSNFLLTQSPCLNFTKWDLMEKRKKKELGTSDFSLLDVHLIAKTMLSKIINNPIGMN